MTPKRLVIAGSGALVVSLLITLVTPHVFALLTPRLAASDHVVIFAQVVSWLSQATLYGGIGLLLVAALVTALRTPSPEPARDSVVDWYE